MTEFRNETVENALNCFGHGGSLTAEIEQQNTKDDAHHDCSRSMIMKYSVFRLYG